MFAAVNASDQGRNRLRVVWISDYPIEWMPDLPEALRGLPRQHPATWVRVLLQEFQRRGDVEVHVIALRSRVKESVTFKQDGVSYHILRASRAGRLLSVFWLDAVLIRRELKRIQPDLVHAWGTERAAALVASRLGRPYLVTLQGLLEWYALTAPDTRLFPKLMTRLEPIALRKARVATTESQFGLNFLSERYPGLRLHQAEHASSNAFHWAKRAPQLKPIKLIYLGTLGHRKGTDLLCKSLAQLTPEFRFEVVVVSGPNRQYLESLRDGLPPTFWERVTFKVDLAPEEVAQELSTATLLLLPTRSDTSPNAVKEAAVVGVPVIASEVGGIPDYITHGKNGLLFPAGDLAAFTKALREAFTHPLFSQGQVDPQTWSQVRDYLSPERMGERFFEAYQLTLKAWGATSKD